jgi:FkbM family methyltransferase
VSIEQPKTKPSLFNMGLNLYRMSFKRVPFFHRAFHELSRKLMFPIMEAVQGFHTMPDDPFWFRFELLTGRHEPETTATFNRLIKPNMTFLDIGAHVGYYARRASDLVGSSGKVVAFEPHPRNHAMLKQNVGNRQNVTLLQVALAESEGTAELHDYLLMSASGSLHYDQTLRDVQEQAQKRSADDFAPRFDEGFTPQTYSVRTASVDSLLADLGIKSVDVVKMDIEGAEMGALRGMQQTIANSPNLSLVMEYNPLGLKAFDNEPLAALKEVLAMGFTKLYVIQADASLVDYTQNEKGLAALTEQLMTHMGVVNLLLQRSHEAVG